MVEDALNGLNERTNLDQYLSGRGLNPYEYWGETMEDLLYKISIQHEVDPAVVSQILDIERKNVYKKRRNIFGDLRKLIEESAEAEAKKHDY